MRIFYTILFLVFMTGCQSIVDFPEIPDAGRYPVIEGLLTDQYEIQKVRVSFTSRLNDTLSSFPVSNARVRVFSNAGDTFSYHYTEHGWYQSDPFRASMSKIYTLKVDIDTIGFQASGSLIAMHGIDSLFTKRGNNSNPALYKIFANAGKVDQSSIHYYQIDIYRNDTLLTGGSNIAVFNDHYLTSLDEVMLPYDYLTNDSVRIELLSLSKGMFDYYLAISNNIFNLNFINSGYQINLPQMFGKSALGYFQVSSIQRKQIVVKP